MFALNPKPLAACCSVLDLVHVLMGMKAKLRIVPTKLLAEGFRVRQKVLQRSLKQWVNIYAYLYIQHMLSSWSCPTISP